jgi:glycerophosphoryl diester phosphodiesterase
MNTIKVERNNTKMIAHRGLSALETENTHAAFIAAGNRSYYGIECDIHKTQDNFFVVIHDDNTKRVAPINYEIKDTKYEDLISLNLYHTDSLTPKSYLKIPTFEEYLDICIRYDKVGVIEFKNEFLEADIAKVIDIVKNKNYLDKVIFISFHLNNLINVRKLYPTLPLQLLTSEYKEQVLCDCLNYKLDLDILHSALNQELVQFLHQQKIQVNVWTVNDLEVAKRLISWNVDYITTNILE